LSITDASDKNQVKFGETARLTAQATRRPAVARSLTHGTRIIGAVRGSGASVTFDSSTVPFDPAKTFQPESRTAHDRADGCDQRGRTATAIRSRSSSTKDAQQDGSTT